MLIWTESESPYSIINFRVTTPYTDPPTPHEFWANEYKWGLGEFYASKAEADGNRAEGRISCIHVREVIE